MPTIISLSRLVVFAPPQTQGNIELPEKKSEEYELRQFHRPESGLDREYSYSENTERHEYVGFTEWILNCTVSSWINNCQLAGIIFLINKQNFIDAC